jgi:RNA polymerase sigma-70 factor (ECF subfamily)
LIDPEIIEECRKGNMANFRMLVDPSSVIIFRLAFRMLGDEEKARDVVQDTLVSVWQKIDTIKSPEVYRTWIYRIAMNKCYDELRRRKKIPEYGADEKTWSLISERIADGSASSFENREIASVINVLTNRLSPKQKAVFILSDIEELSSDEVSAVTGMTKVLVKANLHYARKRIAELLERYI